MQEEKCESVMGYGVSELLPHHIWEDIFSWLPILSLLRITVVCKMWNSIIHSQSFLAAYRKVSHRDDVYFFLFADFCNRYVSATYNPTEDKWVLISLSHFSSSCPSTCCKLRRTLVSDGSLVLAEDRKGSIIVANLFTRTYRSVPPMMPLIWPYPIAMIQLNSTFKIVAVSTADRVYSQVYDSEIDAWEAKGELDARFAMLGNATYLDGLLYCLTHGPDNLLVFNLKHGTWSIVDVVMPSVVCSHILVHNGNLILVGGVEEVGVMKKIGIWELDLVQRQWHNICYMPDHLFSKFSQGNLNHFFTVDGQGKLCFCKSMSTLALMYDISLKRWWWLPPCPLGNHLSKQCWFGHAVEPRIDMLV